MENILNKEDLLEKAINSLRQIFDVKARTYKGFGFDTDYEIELEFSLKDKIVKKSFELEIKFSVTPATISQMLLSKDNSNLKTILVTNYVLPQTAEKLRNLNIPFIDTKGNIFFNEDEFYIFISSQAKISNVKLPKPNLIFQPSGLKLLFVLLSIPNSENETYRKLAEMADISLGSVNEIINNLQQEFYLIKKADKRLLLRKDELIKRWVQGYSEVLRPKLRKFYFQIPEQSWQKEIDITKTKALWGGEVAAKNLTNFLQPSRFTIYTSDFYVTVRYLQTYGLKRSPRGEVEVFDKFWKFDDDTVNVPPLLIYADLVATADTRNLETAQMIYDEYLARLVE